MAEAKRSCAVTAVVRCSSQAYASFSSGSSSFPETLRSQSQMPISHSSISPTPPPTAPSTTTFAFNLTIRNPNKRLGISYRRIRVIGNYQNKRFAMVTLPNTTVPFYQGHKNTTFLRDIVVQGQQVVKFGEKEISEFNKETAAGIYSIDAVLALRVKLRLGTIKFHNYGPENIHCKLKLPLGTRNSTLNQTSTSSFTLTKCGDVSAVAGFFLSWFS